VSLQIRKLAQRSMQEVVVANVIGVLLAAYLVVGFFLCDNGRAHEKLRFRFLNALVHAAFSYIFLQEWVAWWVPVYVFIVFLIIESIPWYRSRPATDFVINQIAHVFSLLLLGWLCQRFWGITEFSGVGYKSIIIIAGLIATVRGIARYIERFVAPLIEELKEEKELKFSGLRNGGKLIGQLERSLIFLLVFINQPMGIGFLVAAKSILRFEEAKDQKLAEYVLIGTLLSFSLAIGITLLTKWAMNL
jgi:hypothetical protein